MIAAVGRFEMAPLVDAVRSMASNSNPACDHELRAEGDGFIHDCGWGIVFREGDRLERQRSAESCLDDPKFDLLSEISTDLAILHARRTPDRGTINVLNSHPFMEDWRGESWAFCHNGTVKDVTQLSGRDTDVSEERVDSELLFHHILARLDVDDPPGSLTEILGELRDFTCLNCFLATATGITAHARMAPDATSPRYYALRHGRGDGAVIVSSEPVPLPAVEWGPVPDGTSIQLSV